MASGAVRVGAVIVNWRKPAATRACLRALAALEPPGCFPVVVENGSSDFTDAELAGAGGRRVVSPTNVGFAAGANLGMRAALEAGADWVWFVNDDATPEPGALAALLAASAKPPYPQVLGPKVLQQSRPDRLDSVALDLDLASGHCRLLGHDEVDRGQYDSGPEPIAVTGCALLVSRSACIELGGFEEAYFAYFEDADLCLRARRAGLHVATVPAARVLHDRPAAHAGRQSPASVYYSVRNHLVLVALFNPQPPWLTRLRSLRIFAGYLAFAALRSSSAAAAVRAARRGLADYQSSRMGAAPPEIGE
jgi:GT2 family glycosyltransferase